MMTASSAGTIEANSGSTRPTRAVLTIAVLVITAALSVAGVAFPAVLGALERTPGAISANQWWRLITPVFINRGGWIEIVLNVVTLAIVGVTAERVWTRGRWALFYLLSGVAGELAGLAWKPVGAGTSVAMCGLLGALAAWGFWRRTALASQIGAVVLVAGAAVLVIRGNIHGPPLLVGFGVAAWLLWRDRSGMRRG